jgi:hypothetical protein
VAEYTPLQVKQAITGYGGADKVQMQEMVRLLLGLSEKPHPDDAADALAISICHHHSTRLNTLLGEQRGAVMIASLLRTGSSHQGWRYHPRCRGRRLSGSCDGSLLSDLTQVGKALTLYNPYGGARKRHRLYVSPPLKNAICSLCCLM